MIHRVLGLGLSGWLILFSALAIAVEPDPSGMISSADGNGYIRIDSPHTYASAFLDTDTYSAHYSLPVHPEHRGKAAWVYLGANHNGTWFLATPAGWQPWDGAVQAPAPLRQEVLQDAVNIQLFDQDYLPSGDIEIHLAYLVPGEPLIIGEHPLRFNIQPAGQDTLHRFRSAQALEDFLKQGLAKSASNRFYAMTEFAEAADADSVSPAAPSGRVSTTNLQEAGVDEADIMKSDGEHLLLLRDCAASTCVVTYRLDSANAQAMELASRAFSGSQRASGMYLVKGRADGDRLIVLGSNPSYHLWLDVWGWTGNTTQLEFFDASDPAALESLETLTLDGSLISSRRVGDTLYLVTRHTPYLEGYQPYAYDEQFLAENVTRLSNTGLSDLLPRVTDASQRELSLLNADDCFVPTSNLDSSINPSIISVTAIPLAEPTAFTSSCFVGESETLYMTAESIYLATTQFQVARMEFDRLFYQPEHTTAVHKFTLQEEGIEYRGSGQVQGHLGWSEDKKPFRMGENGEFLNMVTSVGTTWDGSSSTLLTVLRESPTDNQLQTVATVEGIGKPGEQLYAARFLGDRAYLVTFLLTDPLYVLDLSDQENPLIAGELEIDGYSDYLHPVSETLLLGIGKDAVADQSSLDFNGTRGAWYQGVKLSLFDVGDPASPVELDALVLGKRGTQSEVLFDHHALAFLPAADGTPARLTIPVDLHDTVPGYPWFDAAEPSAFYDYTHTGLYSFEITEQAINQAGLIFGTEPGSGGFQGYFGDRSVLVDDAVFYLHGGQVNASHWGESP